MSRLVFRLLTICCSLIFFGAASPARGEEWTQAFTASPASYHVDQTVRDLIGASAPIGPIDGTLRFTLFVAAGGNSLRVRLTNEANSQPLYINAASIAAAGEEAGSSRGDVIPLTFGGRADIIIPPGALALSDPIRFRTRAMDRLVISVYTTQGLTLDALGSAGMLLAPGDQTAQSSLSNSRMVLGRPVVSGVSVASETSKSVIVALGDSITDGTRDSDNALHGYTEHLARRFSQLHAGRDYSVVNAGIRGNRLLTTGWGDNVLARLERDALGLDGVTHVILLEGINDIGMSGNPAFGTDIEVTADDIVSAYQQVIARAHARGIAVIGGTLMPFKGSFYYSAEKEAIRERVNAWIRTSGAFDAVIDFDAVMRSPSDPLMLRPDYDSGDHLHPNDNGYRAMADAIDLTQFRRLAQ